MLRSAQSKKSCSSVVWYFAPFCRSPTALSQVQVRPILSICNRRQGITIVARVCQVVVGCQIPHHPFETLFPRRDPPEPSLPGRDPSKLLFPRKHPLETLVASLTEFNCFFKNPPCIVHFYYYLSFSPFIHFNLSSQNK